jgi:hypothetical protein
LDSNHRALVRFADQPRDRKGVIEIDEHLFTRYDCRHFDNGADAIAFFDDEWRRIEPISKRLTPTFNLHLKSPLLVFEMMETHCCDSSVLTYDVQMNIQAWIHFVILYSHRVTMIQSFYVHEFAALCRTGTASASSARRALDFPQLYDKVTEALLGVPVAFAEVVADALVNELKWGIKNQLLTHHFVTGFIGRIMHAPAIARFVTWKLFAYFIEVMELFVTHDYQDSLLVHQIFFLLIRVGTPPDPTVPNLYLGRLLRYNYDAIFVQLAVHIRRVAAQRLALDVLFWLRSSRNFHCKGDPDDHRKSSLPFRRTLFEEVHACARHPAASLFIDATLKDISTLALPGFANFLIDALRSKCTTTLNNAIDMFIEMTEKGPGQRALGTESDVFAPHFDAFFDILRRADPEHALKVARSSPSLSQLFVKQSASVPRDPGGIVFPSFRISVEAALIRVATGLSDSPEEAPYLFLFLQECVALVRQFYITENAGIGPLVDLIVRLLAGFLKFEIRLLVRRYFREMSLWFARHTLMHIRNHYFLALLTAAGLIRSNVSNLLCEILQEYVSEVAKLDGAPQIFSHMITDLFGMITSPVVHFVFLYAMRCVGEICHEAIRAEHITTLLIFCCHNVQHDNRFNELFRLVFAAFFREAGDRDRTTLLLFVYEHANRLSGMIRFLIVSSLAEFPTRLPAESGTMIELI